MEKVNLYYISVESLNLNIIIRRKNKKEIENIQCKINFMKLFYICNFIYYNNILDVSYIELDS